MDPQAIDIHAITQYVPSLLLHFARAGAFLYALQLFGAQRESKMLRLVLAMSLASMFWWLDEDKTMSAVGGFEHFAASGWMGLTISSMLEVAIGLAAGFTLSLITGCLSTAGEIVSHDMGFSMAQIMNPVTGRSSAVMSQFFQTIGMLSIFSLNLHHGFLMVLQKTYSLIPVGRGFDITPVFERINGLVGDALEFAMRYAIPIMGVLVLLTAVLVMLSRAVSNINLMEFSFGLRILLAMFSSVFFISQGMPFLEMMFHHMLDGAYGLFEGA